MSGSDTTIDDKYNLHDQVDTRKLKQEALEEEPESDPSTQFLNIYKEQPAADPSALEDQGPKEIRYKQETNEEEAPLPNLLASDGQAKPLIQELKSENL